jgi:hypothetical protein
MLDWRIVADINQAMDFPARLVVRHFSFYPRFAAIKGVKNPVA